MAMLDGFMRPNYGSDPGILGLYKFVQSGYDAGKARGQNDALRQYAKAAYTDTGDAQKQDIANAIGVDPRAGYQLAGMAQQQQARQQAQQLAQFQRVGKAASAIIAAKQRGDETTAEGIYQAIVPELGLMSAQHGGPTPPPNLNAADMGALYKVAAMYSQLPEQAKGVVVAPGGKLVNPESGQQMFANPAAAKIIGGNAVTQGPNGTLVASPIPFAGAGAPAQVAPQTPGLNTSVPGTNGQNVTFDFPPGTPPEVIAAAKASAVANGDIAPGAQVGAPQAQPQTLAQAIGTGKAKAQTAPSGYRWNADHTALQPIPGGPADKGGNIQGEGQAALFGDPSKTGADYLATIPAGNQEIVRGLLNGTVALPSGTALKNGMWQSALASVKHADPTWNQAAYKQFADTRKWATTGQGGQLINSINTASQHLDKLRQDIEALHNGNFSALNAVGNFVSTQTGGQAVTNFNADLTPVASELAAVYKGKGVPSDEEIRHFREALTPNMSYGQQMNIIRGWIDLMAGKLNATREQYRGSMSKLSAPLSVINPRAAEALERVTDLANQVSTTGQHAIPQEDTAPIHAPGQQAPQSPAGWSIQEVQQ